MIARLGALLIAGSALAAPAQVAAPPAPAPGIAADPAARATADRLMLLLFSDESMRPALSRSLDPLLMVDGGVDDPNRAERLRISAEVTRRAVDELIVELGPAMRAAMAEYYARHFSVAELEQIIAFLSTPTGAKYAHTALAMPTDRAFLETMERMGPRMMQGFATIAERVRAATAHLMPAAVEIVEPVEGNIQ